MDQIRNLGRSDRTTMVLKQIVGVLVLTKEIYRSLARLCGKKQ